MSGSDCPSDLELQAFRAAKSDDPSAQRIASHLRSCTACQSRVEQRKTSSAVEETEIEYKRPTSRAQSDSQGRVAGVPNAQPSGDLADQSKLTALSNFNDSFPSISLRLPAGEEEEFDGVSDLTPVPNGNTGGRYVLEGEIARGGMGAILAGRDNDLGRKIAIKVLLERHQNNSTVTQRFVEEAQISGQLQHPGIAPVYELGKLEDERPFFSMKLVKGETLAVLLQERKEPDEERGKFLGIFEQICQTMAYAHSRGVIHRDLKPSNIMVGAFGEVQVMDWGLAKVLPQGDPTSDGQKDESPANQSIIHTLRSGGDTATSDPGESDVTATLMGTVMGTPCYMPPEQALGQVDVMDERADVFGLGAILCQILTGKPPYVGDDSSHVLELARLGSLTSCWERLDASHVDGDLIAIAKDCLQPEPRTRPRDAGALADRITAYLESVEAKLQVSELERAAETARLEEEQKRRRVSLALVTSVLLFVTLGGSGWLYMEQRKSQRQVEHARELESINGMLTAKNLAEMKARDDAERARDDAEAARQVADLARTEAEQVSGFLVGLFEDADPVARTERMFGAQRRGDGDLTAVEVVNRGRKKLEQELLDQPRVRALLLDKIGNVYLGLDRASDAETLLQEAERIRLKEFGPESSEYAQTLESLGMLYMNRNEGSKSNAALKQALEIRRAESPPQPLLIANTLFHLGTQQSLECEYDSAEQSLKECLQIRRAHYQVDGKAMDHVDVAAAQFMLGQVYVANDEVTKAIPLLQQAAATSDKLQGSNGFSSILSLFIQAQLLAKFGNVTTARKLFEQVEEKGRKLLGEDHLIVAFSRLIFARFLTENKKFDDAVVKLQQVIRGYKKSMGPTAPAVGSRLIDLTRVQRRLPDPEAAEISIRESVGIFRARGAVHAHAYDHATSLHIFGALMDNRGERAEAEKLLLEGLDVLFRNDQAATRRAIMMARDYAAMLLEYPSSQREFRGHLGPAATPEMNLRLAIHWAKAAQVQQTRAEELSDIEQRTAAFLCKQAVELLKDAVANGFRDVATVKDSPAFQALQDREDFQMLLTQMAADAGKVTPKKTGRESQSP